jgi:alkylhydroperoxidase family enzyme
MNHRIAPAEPPFPESVQASFDRMPKDWMPPFRLFTTLARDPNLYGFFTRGAPVYFAGSNITVRQREVLLLRVTARCQCAYEWGMRVHYFSESAGLSEEQVYATVHGDAYGSCWDEADRTILKLADSLHDHATIDAELWEQLSPAFSDEAILELILLAGHYRTTAYLSNGLAFPLEPHVGRPFPAPKESPS